jgi:hypothetical protein
LIPAYVSDRGGVAGTGLAVGATVSKGIPTMHFHEDPNLRPDEIQPLTRRQQNRDERALRGRTWLKNGRPKPRRRQTGTLPNCSGWTRIRSGAMLCFACNAGTGP